MTAAMNAAPAAVSRETCIALTKAVLARSGIGPAILLAIAVGTLDLRRELAGEAGDVDVACVGGGEDAPDHRDSDRTTDLAREVVECGSHSLLGWWERFGDRACGRRHRCSHADPEHRQTGGHQPVGGARAEPARRSRAPCPPEPSRRRKRFGCRSGSLTAVPAARSGSSCRRVGAPARRPGAPNRHGRSGGTALRRYAYL